MVDAELGGERAPTAANGRIGQNVQAKENAKQERLMRWHVVPTAPYKSVPAPNNANGVSLAHAAKAANALRER